MDLTAFIPLLQNAVLLLVLSVVFEIVSLFPERIHRLRMTIIGILVSVICIAVMSMPYALHPGIMVDTRSIVISVTALVFGPIPTAITSFFAIVYRVILGGEGTLSGIVIIAACALTGLSWRRWFRSVQKKWRWLNVYLMGVTVHIVMLVGVLLLPYPLNIHTIRAIALPVLSLFPLTAMLLSLLLIRQQESVNLQNQVKQSEEWFRELFESAPLGYQLLDHEGKIVNVNQKWLDMLGYARNEVIGQKLSSFLTAQYRDGCNERYFASNLKQQLHSELEMHHRDGHIVYVSFERKVLQNASEEFSQTHWLLQDITTQKTVQQNLRESEEEYKRLFETMDQGVIYQDAEGKITSVNPAAERIVGLTFDQMRGKTPMEAQWQTISEDGSELAGEDFPAMVALRTNKPYGPVTVGTRQHSSNESVWLSVYAMPQCKPGETTPYQVYTLFMDITQERNARQNYQGLFKEMIDAFAVHEIICDEQGKPVNYRFLTVNPAFETMTGLKAKDIIGKTVLDVIAQLEPFWIETYGKVALTGEPIQFENYSQFSGKYFSVSAYQPKPMQFACSFTDITQRVLAEKEAQGNLHRLQGMLDHSPGIMMILEQSGHCMKASSYLADLLAMPKEMLEHKQVTEFLPSRIAGKLMQAITQLGQHDSILEGVDVFHLQGEQRYFESRFFAIPSADDQQKLFGYIGMDVTERMLAEQALQASEKRYSSYVKSAPDGIAILDTAGQIIEINDAVCKITGYTKEDMLKRNIMDLVDERFAEQGKQLFQTLVVMEAVHGELQYIHQNGDSRWANINAVQLSQDRFLSFMSDITQQKGAADLLIYASNHDHLTGLWNRKYFEEQVVQLDDAQQLPLSIIIADINGLKLINDSFGRAKGDQMLVETAAFISRYCRPGDILARTSGDEFSVLLPKTSKETAAALWADIQNGCCAHNQEIADDFLQMNLTLGTATKETPDEDFVAVMKAAEDTMNQRKLLEQKSSHSSIIATVKATMLEKSHETEAHEERMARLARRVGEIIGLSQIDLDYMELLAGLHDIGKVGISEQILNKPAKLTEEEWQEMKKHPEIGERIAMSTSSLAPIAYTILCHHERWDGTGYPQQLSGTDIPLLSRIIAVVDAYDAMTQDRVYQKAISHEDALAEIKKHAGTQFDPDIARIFCEEVFCK